MLFTGCKRAASEVPRTGEGPLDIQDTALKLYRERSSPPTDFKFLEVFNFVSTKPKFNAMLEEMGRKERGPEKAVGKSSGRDNDAVSLDLTSEADSIPSRPMGQKKAKKARLAEGDKSRDRQTFFGLLTTRTATIQEHNRLTVEANDIALLGMVHPDAMTPSLRAVWEMKQAAMLKRSAVDSAQEAVADTEANGDGEAQSEAQAGGSRKGKERAQELDG